MLTRLRKKQMMDAGKDKVEVPRPVLNGEEKNKEDNLHSLADPSTSRNIEEVENFEINEITRESKEIGINTEDIEKENIKENLPLREETEVLIPDVQMTSTEKNPPAMQRSPGIEGWPPVKEKLDRRKDNQRTINCVKFNAGNQIDIQSWIKLFDYLCEQEQLGDSWKVQNIATYLEGEALLYYINHCMGIQDWSEIKQNFRDFFTTTEHRTYEAFFKRKLQEDEVIEDYFRVKITAGRKLNLAEEIILEALTNGLPRRMQEILCIKDIPSISEWLKSAVKLRSLQRDDEKRKEEIKEDRSRNNQPRWMPRMPWRPATPYRQWTPRPQVQQPWSQRIPTRPQAIKGNPPQQQWSSYPQPQRWRPRDPQVPYNAPTPPRDYEGRNQMQNVSHQGAECWLGNRTQEAEPQTQVKTLEDNRKNN